MGTHLPQPYTVTCSTLELISDSALPCRTYQRQCACVSYDINDELYLCLMRVRTHRQTEEKDAGGDSSTQAEKFSGWAKADNADPEGTLQISHPHATSLQRMKCRPVPVASHSSHLLY